MLVDTARWTIEMCSDAAWRYVLVWSLGRCRDDASRVVDCTMGGMWIELSTAGEHLLNKLGRRVWSILVFGLVEGEECEGELE